MKLAIAFTALLIAAPAYAQSLGERTGVNSALGVAPSTADFVKEVASSDMYEIRSSEIAQSKGGDKVKSFAAQMIADHQKTSMELKGIAQKSGLEVPTTMLPTHQKLLDNLNNLSGDKLAEQYVDDQVTAHKSAVSLFERYSSSSADNPELKNWAGKTLPALQHHLSMVQAMDK